MVRSQLNSYSGGDPIWGFVTLIGNERFTGEAVVGIDPRVRLFAVDGSVYFAEREGDAPISTRLVNCGAITTAQLEHGSVRIGDTTSLARLFQREPSIDRDAVELTIATSTEALIESVANKAVGMPEVFPLRHHASGIHHWLRAAGAPASLALPSVEDPAPEPEPKPAPALAPLAQPSWQPQVTTLTSLEPDFEFETSSETQTPHAVADYVVADVVAETAAADMTPSFDPFAELAGSGDALPTLTSRAVAQDVPAAAEVAAADDLMAEPVASATAPMAVALPMLTTFSDMAQSSVAHEPSVDTEATDTQPVLPSSVPSLGSLTPLAQLAPLAPLAPVGDVAVAPAPAAAAQTTKPYEPAPAPVGLPKLATAPISMDDSANSGSAAAWAAPGKSNTAVGIWEMVDDLIDDGRKGEQELVGSGGGAKRGRGWLRGRKG